MRTANKPQVKFNHKAYTKINGYQATLARLAEDEESPNSRCLSYVVNQGQFMPSFFLNRVPLASETFAANFDLTGMQDNSSHFFEFEGAVMQGIMRLTVSLNSVFTLMICAASFSILTDEAFAEDAEPQIRRPHIVGGNYEYEDSGSIDETIATRLFVVPMGAGQSIRLDTSYDFSPLAASDAAFNGIYRQKLSPSKYWQSIEVSVGYFSQDDGCSDKLDVVYTLSNQKVFAMFSDNTVLAYSDCERSNFGSEGNGSRWDMCKQEIQCIKNYFKDLENRKNLYSTQLEIVRKLNVK